MKRKFVECTNKLVEKLLANFRAEMEQRFQEHALNLKNNNQILEEYALNLQNNNKSLEMIEKNLNDINALTPDMQKCISQVEQMSSKMEMLEVKVRKSEKRVMQDSQVNPQEVVTECKAEVSSGKNENQYSAIDYFDFENYFRGSIEHVKRVQKIYLPYFEGCSKVVDAGCGRGEFLELLKENNIEATGVDYYDEYAEYCRMKGLNAVCDDAIHFLEQVDTVDGLFAGQLVEHLQTEQVIRLCELAYEKLEEGGYAIFETPNPTSLAIFTNSFYIDPSHVKPVHPLTLKYFMEKAGFKDISILYTESSKVDVSIPKIMSQENADEFNKAMEIVQNTLFGSQDYAIIARK